MMDVTTRHGSVRFVSLQPPDSGRVTLYRRPCVLNGEDDSTAKVLTLFRARNERHRPIGARGSSRAISRGLTVRARDDGLLLARDGWGGRLTGHRIRNRAEKWTPGGAAMADVARFPGLSESLHPDGIPARTAHAYNPVGGWGVLV